jgi:DsbC/DsbD-like thiol-disulfide interchange protein
VKNGILLINGLALLLLGSFVSFAQTPDRVELKLNGPAGANKPGKKFEARIVVKIEDGWHVYGLTKMPSGPIPTQITLSPGQPFTLSGEIGSPVPTVDRDSAFGVDVEFYTGEAEFTLPIKVATKALSGTRQLVVNVRFQVCSGSMCLRPQTVKLTAPVIVGNTIPSRRSLKGRST